MALIARERHGVGQQVDGSLYGSQIALLAFQVTTALRLGRQPARRDSATFTLYCGSDGGWFTVAFLDPAVYPRLCRAIGRDALATDPRFAGPFERDHHNDELHEELRATFAARPRDYWFEQLIAHDIPCGPVQGYLEIGEDEQALANGYVRTVEHPNLGPLRVVGPPVELSATPAEVGIAPELGQHTEEVLQELGYAWDEFEAFKDAGVI
jgi:crotonobetainyl-CoA:carnitine CoA-transferase CaiB-like acyl-CoA transferase